MNWIWKSKNCFCLSKFQDFNLFSAIIIMNTKPLWTMSIPLTTELSTLVQIQTLLIHPSCILLHLWPANVRTHPPTIIQVRTVCILHLSTFPVIHQSTTTTTTLNVSFSLEGAWINSGFGVQVVIKCQVWRKILCHYFCCDICIVSINVHIWHFRFRSI